MLVSPAERQELIRRVSHEAATRSIDVDLVRSAVDRVIVALESRRAPSPDGERVVVVTGECVPDLSSRVRAAAGGASWSDWAVASEGRHTVLVARVDASSVAAVRAAAELVGGRFVVQEPT
jgi:hypothetical protein